MKRLGHPTTACGCCTDCRVCFRILDEETGLPISGATVLIRAGITGTGAVLANAVTGSDGKVCTTANVAAGASYRATITIPSKWGPNAVFTGVTGTQTTPCQGVRDLAFCQSRMTVYATNCLTSGSLAGLNRTGFATGTPGTYFINVATTTTCPSSPKYNSGYLHYASITPGLGYNPGTDPAAGIDGPGTYTEIWFSLREMPFTCAARQWAWRLNATGAIVGSGCDQNGRHKPRCGNAPIACGADIDIVGSSFPYGTDWTTAIGSDGCLPACDFGIDGIVSLEAQTDCTPSGLMKRSLYLTMTSNDNVDTIGTLVGVPILLTCVNSGSTHIYESNFITNSAGTITCCEISGGGFNLSNCTTQKFNRSKVTLTGTGSNFSVSWQNSWTGMCPTDFGVVSQLGLGGTMTGAGTCHPTLSTVSGTMLAASGPVSGEVSE